MLNKKTIEGSFLAVFLATICLMSCQNEPKKAAKMTGLAGALQDSSVMRIWPLEVDSLKKIDPNIPMIDVRSELEFRSSHIFRAMNCDVNSPDFQQRILKIGLGQPVIVYDEDSSRSLKAAEIMSKMGFKRTYELAGGIFTWAKAGKTLVAGNSNIDSTTILK